MKEKLKIIEQKIDTLTQEVLKISAELNKLRTEYQEDMKRFKSRSASNFGH